MKARLAAICAGAFLVSACASQAPTPTFHELALIHQLPAAEQRTLSLPFDAYIVGIEKDNRSRVGTVRECGTGPDTSNCLQIDAPYFTARPDLRDALRAKYADQFRPTYISHIARFDDQGAACFLYNTYVDGGGCAERSTLSPNTLVNESWLALAALGKDISRYVETRHPSHVIVYTMGWTTYQPEALGNIRDLVSQLRAAANAAGDPSFRPLIIGVTWPSTGSPTLRSSDYGIKAKDADEVGAVWENILLNRELRQIKRRHPFKLVVVGHSFGARATSRAVFSAPLVTSESGPVVDLLMGLQGAYSFQRYLGTDGEGSPEGKEGAPYRDFASNVGQVALTSSQFDTAVTSALHGPYFVGSNLVYSRTQGDPFSRRFAHARTTANGTISDVACDASHVLMIDASSVIKGNQPGAGGGAHSDIYTPEIGNLVYQLIHACAA